MSFKNPNWRGGSPVGFGLERELSQLADRSKPTDRSNPTRDLQISSPAP